MENQVESTVYKLNNNNSEFIGNNKKTGRMKSSTVVTFSYTRREILIKFMSELQLYKEPGYLRA